MTNHDRLLSDDDPPYFTDEGEEEDGPSEHAQETIYALTHGGDSQALAVGECLETIASNGGEQARDDYLAGCAYEIASAAVSAANDLDTSTSYSVVNRAELRQLRELLEEIKRGNADFDYLEEQAADLLNTLSCLEREER